MDQDNGSVQIHASLSCCNPQNRSLLIKTPDLYKDISIPDHVKNLKLSSSNSVTQNNRDAAINNNPNNSKVNYESYNDVMISPENLLSGEGIVVPQFTVNYHSETDCHVMADSNSNKFQNDGQVTNHKYANGNPEKSQKLCDKTPTLQCHINSFNLAINDIIDPRLNPINYQSARFKDPMHECNICEESPSPQVTPKCGHVAHEPIIINDHDNMTEDHSDCPHEKDLNDLCDHGERRMTTLTIGGTTLGCSQNNSDIMQ